MPLSPARLDAPALEQGLDPLDAGLVFLRPRQPAAEFLGDELLDVVVERLALDEMHGLEDLGLVGRRGRGLPAGLGPRPECREREDQDDRRDETTGTFHGVPPPKKVERYSTFRRRPSQKPWPARVAGRV